MYEFKDIGYINLTESLTPYIEIENNFIYFYFDALFYDKNFSTFIKPEDMNQIKVTKIKIDPI
jgi:hypothetical protein